MGYLIQSLLCKRFPADYVPGLVLHHSSCVVSAAADVSSSVSCCSLGTTPAKKKAQMQLSYMHAHLNATDRPCSPLWPR